MEKSVLVLGARGRLGGAVARAFAAEGWQVLAQCRPGRGLPDAVPSGLRWLALDAADTEALSRAAAGATVVVHAMSPAYTHRAWRRQAPGLMAAAIDVAVRLRALLLFPGNVYNFGAGMPALLREDTPQRPTTVKGRIRVALEQQLARAAREQGLNAVVLRAGDFFGAGRGSWFDLVMTGKLPQGRFVYPGAMDVPTAWAYLPDLARSFERLARQHRHQEGGHFECLQFAGDSLTGRDWLAVMSELARERGWLPRAGQGARELAVGHLPWPLIRLLGPLVPTWGSLAEMRYLWQTPHALDGEALARRIGPEPHTPLLAAARAALDDLGLAAGAMHQPGPAAGASAPGT